MVYGNVRVDPLFEAPPPAQIRGSSITYEPCASLKTAMSCIVVMEAVDDKIIEWLEHVSDEQCQA